MSDLCAMLELHRMNKPQIVAALCAWMLGVAACAQEKPLLVLSYNIRYDNPDDGPDAWEHRRDGVLRGLSQYPVGIIGLQEALEHQKSWLDVRMPNHATFGVGREDGRDGGEHCPLLIDTTLYTVIDNGTFWLRKSYDEPGKGWDAACERICTWASLIYRPSGDSLWVGNTHFDHLGKKARRFSAEMFSEEGLSEVVPQINAFDHRILLGDFNALPDGPVIAAIAAEWTDGWTAALVQKGQPGTYSGFDPGTVPEQRIDYLFYRGLLPMVQNQVARKHKGRWASDHVPVMGSFQFGTSD